jgi:hypothetical protein
MCKISCNECCRKVFSDSVTLTTVDGVDTLVIDVPAQSFTNGQCGCFVIVQTIPATTPITAPVAITIGGGTDYYPVVNRCGVDIVAAQLRTRRRYPFKVVTNATSAVFKVLKNLSCAPDNSLSVIPTAPATGG